jgi:hypothetical protein
MWGAEVNTPTLAPKAGAKVGHQGIRQEPNNLIPAILNLCDNRQFHA